MLHVSRALSSPARSLFHAQVLLTRVDGFSILLGNVHTIDGSKGHKVTGNKKQRQEFKRRCLVGVLTDLFNKRGEWALAPELAPLQGRPALPAIMCCGDLNLNRQDVLLAVQSLPGTDIAVVGEHAGCGEGGGKWRPGPWPWHPRPPCPSPQALPRLCQAFAKALPSRGKGFPKHWPSLPRVASQPSCQPASQPVTGGGWAREIRCTTWARTTPKCALGR